MADGTSIEWTDATWNPITGCSVVSPGCTNCYAMRLAGTRLKHIDSRKGLTRDTKAGPVWTGEVRLNKQWLYQPFDWKKPRRVFVCAHGDLFAENVPDDWILDVFTVMAAASHHTYQVLTKRADRMREFVSRRDLLDDIYANWYTFSGGACEVQSWPLHNVHLGVSAEDQKRADERVPDLLSTPAKVRFVSAEPLLGPLNLEWALSRNVLDIAMGFHARGRFSPGLETLRPLDQVIVGGENGPRPMHPDWARELRRQCRMTGAAFFFKQWGSFQPVYDRDVDDPDWRRCDEVARQTPRGQWLNLAGGQGFHGERVVRMDRVGKKAAGRLLDGVEHNELPRVTAKK